MTTIAAVATITAAATIIIFFNFYLFIFFVAGEQDVDMAKHWEKTGRYSAV